MISPCQTPKKILRISPVTDARAASLLLVIPVLGLAVACLGHFAALGISVCLALAYLARYPETVLRPILVLLIFLSLATVSMAWSLQRFGPAALLWVLIPLAGVGKMATRMTQGS